MPVVATQKAHRATLARFDALEHNNSGDEFHRILEVTNAEVDTNGAPLERQEATVHVFNRWLKELGAEAPSQTTADEHPCCGCLSLGPDSGPTLLDATLHPDGTVRIVQLTDSDVCQRRRLVTRTWCSAARRAAGAAPLPCEHYLCEEHLKLLLAQSQYLRLPLKIRDWLLRGCCLECAFACAGEEPPPGTGAGASLGPDPCGLALSPRLTDLQVEELRASLVPMMEKLLYPTGLTEQELAVAPFGNEVPVVRNDGDEEEDENDEEGGGVGNGYGTSDMEGIGGGAGVCGSCSVGSNRRRLISLPLRGRNWCFECGCNPAVYIFKFRSDLASDQVLCPACWVALRDARARARATQQQLQHRGDDAAGSAAPPAGLDPVELDLYCCLRPEMLLRLQVMFPRGSAAVAAETISDEEDGEADVPAACPPVQRPLRQQPLPQQEQAQQHVQRQSTQQVSELSQLGQPKVFPPPSQQQQQQPWLWAQHSSHQLMPPPVWPLSQQLDRQLHHQLGPHQITQQHPQHQQQHQQGQMGWGQGPASMGWGLYQRSFSAGQGPQHQKYLASPTLSRSHYAPQQSQPIQQQAPMAQQHWALRQQQPQQATLEQQQQHCASSHAMLLPASSSCMTFSSGIWFSERVRQSRTSMQIDEDLRQMMADPQAYLESSGALSNVYKPQYKPAYLQQPEQMSDLWRRPQQQQLSLLPTPRDPRLGGPVSGTTHPCLLAAQTTQPAHSAAIGPSGSSAAVSWGPHANEQTHFSPHSAGVVQGGWGCEGRVRGVMAYGHGTYGGSLALSHGVGGLASLSTQRAYTKAHDRRMCLLPRTNSADYFDRVAERISGNGAARAERGKEGTGAAWDRPGAGVPFLRQQRLAIQDWPANVGRAQSSGGDCSPSGGGALAATHQMLELPPPPPPEPSIAHGRPLATNVMGDVHANYEQVDNLARIAPGGGSRSCTDTPVDTIGAPPVAVRSTPTCNGAKAGVSNPALSPTPVRDELFPSCSRPEIGTQRYNTRIRLPGRHMAIEQGLPPLPRLPDPAGRREWYDANAVVQDVQYFEGALARGVPHVGPVGLRAACSSAVGTGNVGSGSGGLASLREEDCCYLVRKEAMLRLPDHKRRQLLVLTHDHNARGGPVVFCGPPGLVHDPTNMLNDILTATRVCEEGVRKANVRWGAGGDGDHGVETHLQGPFPWVVGGHEWDKLGPAGLGRDIPQAGTADAAAAAGSENGAEAAAAGATATAREIVVNPNCINGSGGGGGGNSDSATRPPPLRDHFYGPVQLCTMDMAHRYEHHLSMTPVSAAFRPFLGKRSPEEEVDHAHPVTPATLLSYMRGMINTFGVQTDPRVIQVREQCAALRPCATSPAELAQGPTAAAATAAAAAVGRRRTTVLSASADKSEVLARAREQKRPPPQLLAAMAGAAAALASRKRPATGAEPTQARRAAAPERITAAGMASHRPVSRSAAATRGGHASSDSDSLSDDGECEENVAKGGRVPVGLKVPVYPLTADDTLFMTSGELMRLAHRMLMLHAPLWLRDILNERHNDALDFGTCRPTDGGLGVFAHFANILKRPLLALELATFAHVDRSQPATLMSFAIPFTVPADLDDALRRLRSGLADRKHSLWLQARNLTDQWRLQHPAAASRTTPAAATAALGGGDTQPLLNAEANRISKRGSVWVVIPGCRLHQLAQAFNKTTKRGWPRNHNGFFSVKYGRDLDTLVSVCWRWGVPFHVIYHCEGDLLLPGMGAAHAVMPLHCASMKISQDFLAPSGPAVRLLWELDALRQEHHLLWAARRAKELKVEAPPRATAAATAAVSAPVARAKERERNRGQLREEPEQEGKAEGELEDGSGTLQRQLPQQKSSQWQHRLRRDQEMQQVPADTPVNGLQDFSAVAGSLPACQVDEEAAAMAPVEMEEAAATTTAAGGTSAVELAPVAGPLALITPATVASVESRAVAGASTAAVDLAAISGARVDALMQSATGTRVPLTFRTHGQHREWGLCDQKPTVRSTGIGALSSPSCMGAGAWPVAQNEPVQASIHLLRQLQLPEAVLALVAARHAGIDGADKSLEVEQQQQQQKAMQKGPVPSLTAEKRTEGNGCREEGPGELAVRMTVDSGKAPATTAEGDERPNASLANNFVARDGHGDAAVLHKAPSVTRPAPAAVAAAATDSNLMEVIAPEVTEPIAPAPLATAVGAMTDCQCWGSHKVPATRSQQHRLPGSSFFSPGIASSGLTAYMESSEAEDVSGERKGARETEDGEEEVHTGDGADCQHKMRQQERYLRASHAAAHVRSPSDGPCSVDGPSAHVSFPQSQPPLAHISPLPSHAEPVENDVASNDGSDAGGGADAALPDLLAGPSVLLAYDLTAEGGAMMVTETVRKPARAEEPVDGETSGIASVTSIRDGDSAGSTAPALAPVVTTAAERVPGINAATVPAAAARDTAQVARDIVDVIITGCGGPKPTAVASCNSAAIEEVRVSSVIDSAPAIAALLTTPVTDSRPGLAEELAGSGGGGGRMAMDGLGSARLSDLLNGEGIAAGRDANASDADAVVAADADTEATRENAAAVLPVIASPAASGTVSGIGCGVPMECAPGNDALLELRLLEVRSGSSQDPHSVSEQALEGQERNRALVTMPNRSVANAEDQGLELSLQETVIGKSNPSLHMLEMQILAMEQPLLGRRRSLEVMTKLAVAFPPCRQAPGAIQQTQGMEIHASSARKELLSLAPNRLSALQQIIGLAKLVPQSAALFSSAAIASATILALPSEQGTPSLSDTTPHPPVELVQPDNWVGASPMAEDREHLHPIQQHVRRPVAEEEARRPAGREVPAAAFRDSEPMSVHNLDPTRRMTRGSSKQRQVQPRRGNQELTAKGSQLAQNRQQHTLLTSAAAKAEAGATEGRTAPAVKNPTGTSSGGDPGRMAANRKKATGSAAKRVTRAAGPSAGAATSSRPQAERRTPLELASLDSSHRKRGLLEGRSATAKKSRGAATAMGAAATTLAPKVVEKHRLEKPDKAQMATVAAVAPMGMDMGMGGGGSVPTSEHGVALNNARDAFLTQSILVGLALNVSYTRCHQELLRLRGKRAAELATATAANVTFAGEVGNTAFIAVDDVRTVAPPP